MIRSPLSISLAWGGLAVNANTGNYLAIGGSGGLTLTDAVTDGAEVSPGGVVLARGLVTSSLETAIATGAVMRLSYWSASGTFLLAGLGVDSRPRLLELNQHGVPVGNVLILDDRALAIASRPAVSQWLTVAAAGTRYIIGTSSPFGGSDAQLSDCITPDPFVALGGGTCVNGGLVPAWQLNVAHSHAARPLKNGIGGI